MNTTTTWRLHDEWLPPRPRVRPEQRFVLSSFLDGRLAFFPRDHVCFEPYDDSVSSSVASTTVLAGVLSDDRITDLDGRIALAVRPCTPE